MNKKTLLVGCGGSGITTLSRLNEMLAGNPEMRQRIGEDVSYLVIDTEEAKVLTFKENIERQMGGATSPIMRLIQVTSGYVGLEEIVEPNFDNQKDEDALALLQKHWWCAPDKQGNAGKGRAFRAISAPPITTGAAQCAPVSFLTAWNYLPKLKEDVASLLEEIQLRNTDQENPLENLKVYIVAGLAGGTGRGCWNLMAFKIRQVLWDSFKIKVDPVGVFFDAYCFQSRWPGASDQKMSMRMNSLTGISELSAWLRLVIAPEDAYRYALPNLEKPDLKGRTDVVKVPPTGDKDRSPVNAAYLIFGNNGTCRLGDNDQYHEMAAAALYSMVASDTFIDARTSNLLDNVRSFAATTFEVNTIGIRRYMESLVHQEYVARMCQGGCEIDKEASRLVGTWRETPAKDTFFAKSGLYIPAAVTNSDLRAGRGSDSNVLGRLMDAACEELGCNDKGQFNTWGKIEQSLKEDQDADAAKKIARNALVGLDGKSEDILEACVRRLEQGEMPLGKGSLGKTLRSVISSAFYNEGKVDQDSRLKIGALSPSIARARKVAGTLRVAFNTSRRHVVGEKGDPVKITVQGGKCANAEECAKLFHARIDVMSDRKWTDGFKKFSDAEISQLGEEFKKFQRAALFFLIKDCLDDLFTRAENVVVALDGSLETMELGLSDVKAEFVTEMCGSFDKASESEVFGELFTDDDDDSVFQTLREFDSYQKVFRRFLKPITSQEDVKSLVAKPSVNEVPIVSCLIKELDNLIGGGAGTVYATKEDGREAIRKALSELVRDNVGLPSVNGKDFMSATFPLLNVLANNREKWNRLLSHRWNSEDARGKVLDLFRTYLGVTESDLVRNPGEGAAKVGRLPEAITLLKNIVVSMVPTCRPWMQLEGGASPHYLSTIALLPAALKPKEVAELNDAIKAKFGERRPVNLHHRNDKNGGERLPEDRIVLFSAMCVVPKNNGDRNPFNYIGSLQYWKDADLTELLESAEKKSGESYFEWLETEPGRGFWAELVRTYGFVSPLFITNEQLASLRWRPWKPVSEDYDAAKSRRDAAKQALLQGLLGSGVDEELRHEVEAKGWRGFPLLSMKGVGKGAESLVFQRTCREDAFALSWKEGEVLGTTLNAALDHLLGRGQGSGTNEEDLAAQRLMGKELCDALLAEKVAFEKVLMSLAEEKRVAIRKSLSDFLAEQARGRNSSPELWEELYQTWRTGNGL